MTIEDLWQQFFFHLRVKRRSKNTLVYYGCTERVFGRFLAVQGLPADAERVTVTHLRAFLEWLDQKGLAVGGVHGHARAIRAVFNWAFREELLARNPAAWLELPSLVKERLPP